MPRREERASERETPKRALPLCCCSSSARNARPGEKRRVRRAARHRIVGWMAPGDWRETRSEKPESERMSRRPAHSTEARRWADIAITLSRNAAPPQLSTLSSNQLAAPANEIQLSSHCHVVARFERDLTRCASNLVGSVLGSQRGSIGSSLASDTSATDEHLKFRLQIGFAAESSLANSRGRCLH